MLESIIPTLTVHANILYTIILLLITFIITTLLIFSRFKEYTVDDSGKLSMGRLLCFITLIFYLCSMAFVSFSKGVVSDIPTGAIGLMIGLYLGNKFSPTIPFNNKL